MVNAVAETNNPLIPVGWDIAGIALSLVVTAAIIAAVFLLVCTNRRNRRDDRD